MPLQIFISSYGLADYLDQVEPPEDLFDYSKPVFNSVFLTYDKPTLEALLEEMSADYRDMQDEDEKLDLSVESGEWTEDKPWPDAPAGPPYITHILLNHGKPVAMLVIKRVDVAG